MVKVTNVFKVLVWKVCKYELQSAPDKLAGQLQSTIKMITVA